ncbi:zinc ribbon domain-containing protein [Dactylosporangium darangshiense]|uniref:Cas12f1-like TNB domain-containing protein n=1 Tax=Dactylosporangium darangshiense TaxID=579108 RepID=A0ABP8DDK4_9ACTN
MPDVVLVSAPVRRTRGKSKVRNWRREEHAPVAVIRLEVDASAPATRNRVEGLFTAVHALRRAVQRQARDRVAAYWAAHRLREQVGPARARQRFGLSRKALEGAAAEHVERSGWLRHHLTKALAMHLADEVWATCDRHLFPDRTGQRHGPPSVGAWWDSTRIPGRARSHTKPRTWETFRLVGSLAEHQAAYAATRPGSALSQPKTLPTAARPEGQSGWWAYHGPLTVVLTGAGDDVVLPVRLPQGAGQWPRLEHFLAGPSRWHKIDLVRVEDSKAPGGWRYSAHLMILGEGWTSPAVHAQRLLAAQGRTGGVDGNVSNLAIVSMPADPSIAGGLAVDQVLVTPEQRAAAEQDRLTARRRQKALDRSRRNANRDQYRLSTREQARADRRDAAGLPERRVDTPTGPRVADAAGRPQRAYRYDVLTPSYRRTRAEHATAGRSATQAKQARARDVAVRVIQAHGPHLTVEHLDMRAWARMWGRGIALFSPGMLVAALARECVAAGGRLQRAGTQQTALSQQCPCGHRAKKPLAQRTHHCPQCGLVGDRDLVAAAMAACVRLTDPNVPGSAFIDATLRAALRQRLTGQQEALRRSTAPAPNPASAGAVVGAAATPTSGVASAGETVTPLVAQPPMSDGSLLPGPRADHATSPDRPRPGPDHEFRLNS